MADKELTYLEHRAAVEAELAERAKCPAAVEAHHQMSKAYFESAEALRHQVEPRMQKRHG